MDTVKIFNKVKKYYDWGYVSKYTFLYQSAMNITQYYTINKWEKFLMESPIWCWALFGSTSIFIEIGVLFFDETTYQNKKKYLGFIFQEIYGEF